MSRRIRGIGGAVALALVWACQSQPLVESEGGFRHAERGWRIGEPQDAVAGSVGVAAGASWTRVRVPETLLAYRRPGPEGPIWMTLASRCRIALASPRLLARHLRIGIPEHTVRDSSAVWVGGLPGWQQVFDALDGEVVVRVKTVTTIAEGCALDWVLSVRDGLGFGAAERDFDRWWGSFEAPGGATATPLPAEEDP